MPYINRNESLPKSKSEKNFIQTDDYYKASHKDEQLQAYNYELNAAQQVVYELSTKDPKSYLALIQSGYGALIDSSQIKALYPGIANLLLSNRQELANIGANSNLSEEQLKAEYIRINEDTKRKLFDMPESALGNDLARKLLTQLDLKNQYEAKQEESHKNNKDLFNQPALEPMVNSFAKQPTNISMNANWGHAAKALGEKDIILKEEFADRFKFNLKLGLNDSSAAELMDQFRTNPHSVNILILILMVLIGLADNATQILANDAQRLQINVNYSKQLNASIAAFQGMDSAIPLKDKDGNPITDIYSMFCSVFGADDGTNNSQYREKFGSMKTLLQEYKDSDGVSIWSKIENSKTGWTKNDPVNKGLFTKMFGDLLGDADNASAHVGGQKIPPFKNIGGYIYDATTMGNIKDNLSSAVTQATAVSNQANLLTQAHQQYFAQCIEAGATIITIFRTLNQAIFQ